MAPSEKEIKESMKFMKKEIDQLARASYIFETVIVPRAEADLKVLNEMQDQFNKMEAMLTKLKDGKELAPEEVVSAIPVQFR